MARVCLDQVQLDAVTMDDVVHRIALILREQRLNSIHVATVNAQFLQIARLNKRFARILRNADLSVADGLPLVWASRLLRQPLPGRVNGTDLMVRLCESAASNGNTVYFLGGRPGAAEGAAQRLLKNYPSLRIAGIDCPPMGFMDDRELDSASSARIQRVAPDFLFVGLGAPKQEYWIDEHRSLCTGVMVGIGGSFELLAGLTKRAPQAFQRAGLEWFWRLAMEPRRLWRRYLFGNTLFVLLILRQWILDLVTRKTLEKKTSQIGK